MLGGTGDNPSVKILESLAYALGVAPGPRLRHDVVPWQSPAWRDRLARLAPAGRMALTNYLTHTAVALFVFYGIGLGLMGKVGPVWWPLIVVVVISVQVTFCRWWQARFTFGPMEWIWRQATCRPAGGVEKELTAVSLLAARGSRLLTPNS